MCAMSFARETGMKFQQLLLLYNGCLWDEQREEVGKVADTSLILLNKLYQANSDIIDTLEQILYVLCGICWRSREEKALAEIETCFI